MSGGIQPITMPKWGLAMDEGIVSAWLVDEGAEIAQGAEIMDIETSKIANVFESPVGGVLRRRVAGEGETVAVGGLLGVIAGAGVDDAAIDAYVTEFQSNFVPAESGEEGGPEAEVVEVDGLRLRRLVMGEGGVPLVLLHGFGADLEGWAFNQGALAETRAVHALDLPGHGGSTKSLSGGTAEALAGAVVSYLRSEGLSGAHLAGHSLGGAIAVEVALAAPDLVSALTLVAPAGFGSEIAGTDFIQGFIGQSRARKLRSVLEMLVADPALVTADMVENVLKFKRIDGALEALKAVAAANFDGDAQRLDLRGRMDEVSVPVQVIWGAEDRVLPASQAGGLPDAVAVTVLPGAGHIVHMEKSAEVNRLIAGLGG